MKLIPSADIERTASEILEVLVANKIRIVEVDEIFELVKSNLKIQVIVSQRNH